MGSDPARRATSCHRVDHFPLFSFHFFYLRLKRIVYPLYSRLGIKMYTIFCFVKAPWSAILNVLSTSINRSSLGFPVVRFLIITFHWVTFRFMKSATGDPASGLRGMVHKTTLLGLYFSFNSLRRQSSNDSHFASGETGFLETSLVPIIRVNVSTLSSFCSSIILIT